MTTIFKSFQSMRLCALLFVMAYVSLTGCTTMQVNVSNLVTLPASAAIQVGPLANHSDTPLANRQAESILVGLLQAKGFKNIKPFPRKQSCEKLLYCADEAETIARLVSYGRLHHIPYILTGSANEWRYKVGLDGEPVAGVSLMLINTTSGKTIWSGVGSIIGGSRSGLEVVTQQLLGNILASYAAI